MLLVLQTVVCMLQAVSSHSDVGYCNVIMFACLLYTFVLTVITSKPCYRKDDRAMRPYIPISYSP